MLEYILSLFLFIFICLTLMGIFLTNKYKRYFKSRYVELYE